MNELFKTPFGSRLYGTFTETSDYDWKIVHLPPIEKLLIGDKALKNVFFSTSTKEFKNTSDDTDTEYLAIQTLARDVVRGQAYALEVAFAIINAETIDGAEFNHEQEIYKWECETGELVLVDYHIRTFIKELLEKYLTSHMNGMVGYAYHQAKLYGKKGERLNFLKDLQQVLLDTIERGDGDHTIHALTEEGFYDFVQPLLNLADNHPEWFEYKAIHIDDTKNKYYSFKVFNKTYLGTSKVSHVSKILQKAIEAYGSRANKAAENEGHDWKALSHAVRVTFQAIELLQYGKLTLPLAAEHVTVLKKIKAGEVDFITVSNLLNANVDLIDSLKAWTPLRPFSEALYAEFEEWLSRQMISFYGLYDM